MPGSFCPAITVGWIIFRLVPSPWLAKKHGGEHAEYGRREGDYCKDGALLAGIPVT